MPNETTEQQNPTSLADAFGVKLADAHDMLDQVKWAAYFEQLAQHGHRPETDADVEQMAHVGQTLLSNHLTEKVSGEGSSQSVFKAAADHLQLSLGVDTPEATNAHNQAVQDAAEKTAAYAMDENVIAHLLALHEQNVAV